MRDDAGERPAEIFDGVTVTGRPLGLSQSGKCLRLQVAGAGGSYREVLLPCVLIRAANYDDMYAARLTVPQWWAKQERFIT
jgi:hypothetical protein